MTGSLRGSCARLAVLAVGLLLIAAWRCPASHCPASHRPASHCGAPRCPAPRQRRPTAPNRASPGPRPRVRPPSSAGCSRRARTAPTERDVLQYNVVGGQLICDSVALSNSSTHAITVQLYPADAYNIADGGAFAFTAFKDKPKDVGTWIKLPITRVTVPAGRAANIPIVVRVPTNVIPGDAAGGVVAPGHQGPSRRRRRKRERRRARRSRVCASTPRWLACFVPSCR